MEINVLGPVTVTEGASSLNIGGLKQRTVLAMLVAHAGKPLSADTIAQAVYGEDTPARGRRTVQTYVSTLRSVVGDVIVKSGSAWILDADRVEVDAVRFEDLCESARDLGPVPAAEVLREALAIWRGHPYSDVEAHGLLDGEISRLGELRISAQQARLDADLESGRQSDLIGEIEGLLGEHPYREKFRAQHMLALYRAGRQKEALRSYDQMRSLLVEELGVDPTPELQDLEQRILEHDNSLLLGPERSIQKRAMLVADPGDPLELARLPAPEREERLASSASALSSAMARSGGGPAHPAGTATYVVFDSPGDAVAAAEATTLKLDGSAMRIAIDWGDIEVSDSGVSGPPVSRAAVLVSVAHPGQVLMSGEVQSEIISHGAGTGLRFESLGSLDLPGIETKVPVYQLLIGDPPKTFPPLETYRVPAPLPEQGHRSVPGYELREPLGSGSIGLLYRAYQPSVGREVMVEVIGRAEASDPDFIRGFEADAQRLALLDHSNINPLLDYWRGPEGAYLVYRYHRGGFLEGGHVGSPQVVAQVGSALAYAHTYGVVHGTLRPDRIVLDESGNAYLMGFSIGGVQPPSSPEYPAYIAPETLAGKPASVATDVYAFAVLAHEIESGSIGGDQPLNPTMAVLTRAIKEEPSERQESLAELLSELVPAEEAPPGSRFTDTRNPFKGLAAFHESDAGDFFGRSQVTDELVESLSRSRFLAVVGPSGIGKSSVVRAGLIPALRHDAIEDSASWVITDMLPGSHPFLELERALERVAVDLPADIRERFAELDRNSLAGLGRVLPDGSELLLVIDQFEELFTMTDEAVASAFLGLLITAVELNQARVVITLRADFLDRPLLYSEFGELLGESVVTLRAPNPDELGLAIVRPAQGVGVTVDPALAERMTSEVHDRPGALPLLQHALVQMFEARTSDQLELDVYEELGGVTGSLAKRAEAVYAGLADELKPAVKQVFLRLVTVIDDAAPTRRRLRINELEDLDASPAIDSFVRHRLLVLDTDPDTRTPTVEVAHEALLTHWPRLSGWIEATREDLTLSRRLDEAIRDWEMNDQDQAYLLVGGRLAQHQAWTQSTSLTLTAAERDYLERSTTYDETTKTRKRHRRNWIMAGFAAAAAVASVFGVVALQNADTANNERQLAEARGLIASATAVMAENPDLALLLATEGASDLADDPQAVGILREAMTASRTIYFTEAIEDGGSLSGDISPDGHRVVISGDSRVELRDIETGDVVWEYQTGLDGEESFVAAVHVNKGTEIAVAVTWEPFPGDARSTPPDDLDLQILNADSGELLRRYDVGICGMGLGPGQRTVGDTVVLGPAVTQEWYDAYGCSGEAGLGIMGRYQRVDVNTGVVLPLGPVHNMWRLDKPLLGFSDSGGQQLTYDPEERTLEVHDVESGEMLMTVEGLPVAGAVALAPDASIAVLGGSGESNTREHRVYNVETGQEIARLSGHAGNTWAAEFIADGRLLVTTGDDGTVKLWDPVRREPLDSIPTGEGTKWELSLSGDDSRVLVVGDTATVISLDPVGVLDACPGAGVFYIGAGLVVRNDRVLAYALCGDDSPRGYVLDLETGTELGQGPPSESQPIDLSPDGRFIVSQRYVPESDAEPEVFGTVLVTDFETGGQVEMNGLCDWHGQLEGDGCGEPPDQPYAATATDLDFSPDGTMVTMGDWNGNGQVWSAATGESFGSWAFYSGAFTPDGSQLVTFGGLPESIEVRTTDDFTVLVDRPMQADVRYLRVTPDSETIVGVVGTGLVFLDIETLDEVKTMTGLHESDIRDIEISVDGTMIATGGADGFARVWDIETGDLLHEIMVSGNDRVQAVEFANQDQHLLASLAGGPLAVYTLDIDELFGLARAQLVKGLTETECAQFFRDNPCPTLEEMKAG